MEREIKRIVVLVIDDEEIEGKKRKIEILKIGDGIGERWERNRIGEEENLELKIEKRKRRKMEWEDKKLLIEIKKEGEWKREFEMRKEIEKGLKRRIEILKLESKKMGEGLSVGLSLKFEELGLKNGEKLGEILDD